MNDKPPAVEVPENVKTDVRIFMLLIVACVVVYMFSVPVSLAALGLAPLAAFFGVRALVRTRGLNRVAGLRMSLIFGLGLCVFAALAAVGQVLIYDLIEERRDCTSQALTNAAQRECETQYEEAYKERLESWGVSVP